MEKKDGGKDALYWALVVSCWHKLSGLNNHLFIISQFFRSVVQAWHYWLFCIRSYKAEIRVLLDVFLSRAPVFFQAQVWMWWPLLPCRVGLRCLFPCWM